MTPLEVVQLLARYRLRIAGETRLQGEIAAVLDSEGVDFDREVKIGSHDRIDFLIGTTGLEVKVKGAKRNILRQCERYSLSPDIDGLVLATAVATGFPSELNGKPVMVHSLGRSWL